MNIFFTIDSGMRGPGDKILAGEGDQLSNLSTLAEPAIVDVIKNKVAYAS